MEIYIRWLAWLALSCLWKIGTYPKIVRLCLFNTYVHFMQSEVCIQYLIALISLLCFDFGLVLFKEQTLVSMLVIWEVSLRRYLIMRTEIRVERKKDDVGLNCR